MGPARSLFALVAVATVVAGCGSAGGAAGGRPSVVAIESVYGDVAEQVGGTRASVTSIIRSATADPHEYQPKVDDTLALARAGVAIVNGAGYDTFADRLLAATQNGARHVIRVDRIAGARGADPNPHFWYDPATVAAVGRALAATLSSADPGHRTAYRAGAARFAAALAPLERRIAALRARHAGTPFAYSERLPAYMTARLGLVSLTPERFARASEAGTDPPPAAVAAMRALVTQHRVRLLLYNVQTSSPATVSLRALARANGVPVVGVAETKPPGLHYQDWLGGYLDAIGRALR